jgi:hypothetical protein
LPTLPPASADATAAVARNGPGAVAAAEVHASTNDHESADNDRQRPPPKEPLKELTLGRSLPPAPKKPLSTRATSGQGINDADLAEIEARCRRKAEGARWASSRMRRGRARDQTADEVELDDRETADWADRLADRFYFMNSPPSQPTEIGLLDDLGGCFEAAAEAIALIRQSGLERRTRLERALPLLAEAQSALRAANHAIPGEDEPDQTRIFDWLRATAARHQIYIKRFMRADDPADPSRWNDLLERIGAVGARCRKTAKRSEQALFNLALRAPTAEVQEARRLLEGSCAVLIGGLRRPESQRILESALGLNEVVWIETREHQSIEPFESAIARPDVALVLLAIRWSSHAFGDVKEFCDRYKKPLVRLPAGYSPNQVATQILSQCSKQLGGA